MAARYQRLEESVTRFQSVCKAALALLSASKSIRTATFFSIFEGTRAIKQRHQADVKWRAKTLEQIKAGSREYNAFIRDDHGPQQLDDLGNVAAIGKLFDTLT